MSSSNYKIDDSAETVTVRLAESVSQENTCALKMGPHFLEELTQLLETKKSFDIIIVDCTACGFLFTADCLVQAAAIACNLLTLQGAIVFVQSDKSIAYVKENLSGNLSFFIFDSFAAVYDYSTIIARNIQEALGKGIEINRDKADLPQQIMLTTIAVLTPFGIKLKGGMEGSKRRNQVLTLVDNYTPLGSIIQRISGELSFEQVLDELRSMEKAGIIYPISPKLPFLVEHFRNNRSFKLKDYLLAAKLITSEQLDEILESKKSKHLALGTLCVMKELFNARQLEIVLQDQAIFGRLKEERKTTKLVSQDTQVHSLIGNLSTTEPSGVLQNLVSNRAHGILSAEHKERTFRAAFDQGRLAFAKLGQLKGNDAILEFASTWSAGVFVFTEREPPPDLIDDNCAVVGAIEKILLDAALAQDIINEICNRLNKGVNTLLEKLPDKGNLLEKNTLIDPCMQEEEQEEILLSKQDVEDMSRLWQFCDGLSNVREVISKLKTITTLQGVLTIERLLHYKLLGISEVNLDETLDKFRQVIGAISEKISRDRCLSLLRVSLRDTHGYSPCARIFIISSTNQANLIGIDLAAAKSIAFSFSAIVKALEDWQVKFIEYVSHELDKEVLRNIVYKILRP